MAVDKSAFCFECGPYWPFFAQAGPKNGKCLEVLPIFFRTTGLQIKLLMLICSMKFLSPEVALHLYKSTIHPYMEYYCHVWAGAPSCYLELLDKLQKRICRTVGPSLAASLEPLAHRRNMASLSLFYRYYFGRCSSELAQLVPLPFFEGGLLVILIDCMIFLSSFLDVTRMSMSTVSSLAQLDSGILCL